MDFKNDRFFQDYLRKKEKEKKLKEERRRKRIIQENRERRKRHQMMMQEQLMAQMAAFNDAVVNASVDSGGDSGGDTDVSAFLTATGISDSTIETALDTFVTSLKSEGIWDEIITIYPFVTDKTDSADIQAQFKYNLKDPQDTDAAYRLTAAGSVTFNTTGIVTGNGGYFDTHTTILSGAPVSGTSDVTVWHNGTQLQGYWFTSAQFRNFSNGSDAQALGTHIIGRYDANTLVFATPNLYRTGTVIGGGGDYEADLIADTSGGLYGYAMSAYYLRTNTDTSWSVVEENRIGRPTFSPAWNSNELSLYSIVNTLDQTKVQSFQQIINQLQTDLGRATH